MTGGGCYNKLNRKMIFTKRFSNISTKILFYEHLAIEVIKIFRFISRLRNYN